MLSVDEFARLIDHSILLPGQTERDLEEGVSIARRYGVKCVVPKAFQARRAKELLAGSEVRLCIAISFPHGANLTEVKRREAELVLDQGAQELDMVINIGALKSRDYEFVARDIVTVVLACHRHGAGLKVIIETALLTDDEKTQVCQIARCAGADFVKTSTGFGPGGATVADVALMRRVVGADMGVKASGGIRTLADARAMIAAGATRIGASASVAIINELSQ
jgi:deoxyribose-phosphate aldolase